MILAQENGVPVDLIFVVVVLVISALVSLIKWLNRTFGDQAKKEVSAEAPRRAGGAPEGEGKSADSGEALRNFLEEMTGRRPAASEETPGRPVERRPQRPPGQAQRPPRQRERLHPEAMALEEEDQNPRAADRRPARQRPAESRSPKPAARRRPRAARPQPKRSATEIAVLEEAEARPRTAAQGRATPYEAGPKQEWISNLPGTGLQRGIVLMEILGPPRAKKRHGFR